MGMSNFGWILSKDEQYLIIFGGENTNLDRLANIFILNLNNMIFYQSAMRLCHKGVVKAVSVKNEKDAALVAGFIRTVSREYDVYIPSELVPLFNSYFDAEMIYLLHDQNLDGKVTMLCKIQLNDILKNKSSDLHLDFI